MFREDLTPCQGISVTMPVVKVTSSKLGEIEPVLSSMVLVPPVLLLAHLPSSLAQLTMPQLLVFWRPKSKMRETKFVVSKTSLMVGHDHFLHLVMSLVHQPKTPSNGTSRLLTSRIKFNPLIT